MCIYIHIYICIILYAVSACPVPSSDAAYAAASMTSWDISSAV